MCAIMHLKKATWEGRGPALAARFAAHPLDRLDPSATFADFSQHRVLSLSLYIYIFMYIYVCTNIYIYIYICMHKYTCTYAQICIYA